MRDLAITSKILDLHRCILDEVGEEGIGVRGGIVDVETGYQRVEDDGSRKVSGRLAQELVFEVCGFVVSLAAAWVLFHLYERRFLALKRFFPR